MRRLGISSLQDQCPYLPCHYGLVQCLRRRITIHRTPYDEHLPDVHQRTGRYLCCLLKMKCFYLHVFHVSQNRQERKCHADSSSTTVLFNGGKADSSNPKAGSDDRDLLPMRRRAASLAVGGYVQGTPEDADLQYLRTVQGRKDLGPFRGNICYCLNVFFSSLFPVSTTYLSRANEIPWRNGSASDPRSEGHQLFFINQFIFVGKVRSCCARQEQAIERMSVGAQLLAGPQPKPEALDLLIMNSNRTKAFIIATAVLPMVN